MSIEDLVAMEEIGYRLKIFYDITDQELRFQAKSTIEETLLRIPESIREKILKKAIFIIILGSYGCFWLGVFSEDKNEDQLIKTSEGLVLMKIEVPIILLNFEKMGRDYLDEESMRRTLAHEIAHFILGHSGFTGQELETKEEEEANDLIVEWGFKRFL